MDRRSVLIGAAALAAAQGLGIRASASPKPHRRRPSQCGVPWLDTDGKWLVTEDGSHVTLAGVGFRDVKDHNTLRPGTGWLLDLVTNEATGWHANLVRLPVQPPKWLPDPAEYLDLYLWPAVNACIAHDVYCIIDWHYYSRYTDTYEDAATVANTDAFWQTIAAEFSSVPNVLFELYNEPARVGYGESLAAAPGEWTILRPYMQRWADIVRSHAPRNIIVAGTPFSNHVTYPVLDDPLVGSNIAYTLHCYPSHVGKWDGDWFGNLCDALPAIATEWGFEEGAPGGQNGTVSGFGAPWRTFLDSKPNVGWTAWICDPESTPRMWQATGDLSDPSNAWTLLSGNSYMGEFARAWIADRNATCG